MITAETRRESYHEILKSLGKKQSTVFESLQKHRFDCTAGELALFMYDQGDTPSTDRNNVHPRLNELVELNLVEIVGKRKCQVSKRTFAIYRPKAVIQTVKQGSLF
jgi:hypothetical protein